MTRLYGIASAFFVLAISAYVIIEWQQNQQSDDHSIDQTLTPDFIAESLNSDIYNEQGKLSYVIDADRMEHYAGLAVTHFEYPKYTLYPKTNDKPWKIKANEGTLYSNNRVKLENRVKLIATNANSLIQEIHSRTLELDLNTNIVSSEHTVMIQGNGFTIYGSGLIIDLNTKQMTLTEHVKTIIQ